MAPLMTAMIFLCVSGGKAETPSTEAKEKLIEQCIRQMTEPAADGAGKAMAFQMLQELGPDAESAVPALTKALDHEDSYVRIQSAYTLWKVDRQAKAIPLLSKALKDTEIGTRERAMAASALGEIGPSAKAALPALREATKAQEAQIRVNAAWALWAVDQQSELAKPVLIDAIKGGDLNVFSAAAYSLGEIGFDKPGLTALNETIRADSKKNYSFVLHRSLPALANALKSHDAEVRKEAISVMALLSQTISVRASKGDSGARAAITAVTKALKDEDPAVRAMAAEAIKKLDPQTVAKARSHGSPQKKAPATDTAGPEAVAKAFIIAIANKNAKEAAQYILPEQRDEITKELAKGMPPFPSDPEIRVRVKDDGIRADISILNAKRPKSGPPFGLDMKLSNGKWWIVK